MKVSIIIPVYNKVRYMRTVLEQISGQTMQDFECILIDDGSSDGSGEICDWFAAHDSRFKAFHIPNGGVSNARNMGLDRAKGEYITFIDADDEIAPGYLRSLCDGIEGAAADIVIGSSLKFWDGCDNTEKIEAPYEGVVPLSTVFSEFAENQYATGIYGYCWGKMIRSELARKHRFDPGIRLAEDLNYYLSLYPQTRTICFTKDAFYFYRQEAENSSMQKPDCEINYFIQLQIQLKMLHMLEELGYLTGENKQRVTDRVYDYVFFTLFHAPAEETLAYAERIRNLNLPEIRVSDLNRRNWRERCILAPFVCRQDWAVNLVKRAYAMLRRR